MIERVLRAIFADIRLQLLSIFSVAVAFVCLASTLLVAVNIESMQSRFAKSARASVYLVKDVEPQVVQTVRTALLNTQGVVKVEYVSAEQARAEVTESTRDEALSALPAEAFPSSLEVTLEDNAARERILQLEAQLKELDAVESVETYGAWGERWNRLLAGGAQAALVLVAIVLASVISVVGSTMRMALSRRSTEVEVLKIVGATDSYVRGPFIMEGATQGGLGALLAVAIMATLYLIVRDAFDGVLSAMIGASPQFLPLTVCFALVVLGAAIGALSAFASLRRLLRTSIA